MVLWGKKYHKKRRMSKDKVGYTRTQKEKKPLISQRLLDRIGRCWTFYWRRERDSNPRYAINIHTLSRRAPSAARTSLRKKNNIEYQSYLVKVFDDIGFAETVKSTGINACLPASLGHTGWSAPATKEDRWITHELDVVMAER